MRTGVLVLIVIVGGCQLGCAKRVSPATARIVDAAGRPATSAAGVARDPFKKLRDALEAAKARRPPQGADVKASAASNEAHSSGIATSTGKEGDASAVGTSGLPPHNPAAQSGEDAPPTAATPDRSSGSVEPASRRVWMSVMFAAAGIFAALAIYLWSRRRGA